MLGANRAIAAIKVSAMASVILLPAGLAMLAALGFGCAALWSFTAPSLGPGGASLTVAGALLVLALALLLCSWLVRRRGSSPPPPPPEPDQTAVLLEAIGSLVGDHKVGALLAAVIAGAVAEQAARRNR